MRHALLTLLLATSASAVTPEVHRDLFYTEAKDKLQSLDVYSPPEGKDQLTKEEIAILKWWIEQGASATQTLDLKALPSDVQAAAEAIVKG